ncbi:protein GPR107-like [Mercenaria mercenaria]|uniref:protein GPR107-like n=1 Tax=Mercenaria mercenaria TaxID=6596 RepID=UPI001E1D708A|nr:protein GPR107-like [Mercenaria mercenaria]
MAAELSGNNFLGRKLIILLCICVVNGRKHHLDIKTDDRQQYTLSSFGFLKHGTLTVNVTNFVFPQSSSTVDNTTFGFTIDVSSNTGASGYMEDYKEGCILKTKDEQAIIFFRMDFKKDKLFIERRGEDLQNIIISNQTIESFWKTHNMARREARKSVPSALSDTYLFNGRNVGARERRAIVNKEPAPLENQLDKKDDSTTEAPETTTVAKATTPVSEKKKPKTATTISLPLITEIPIIQKSEKSEIYSFYFLLAVTEEEQEGMYTLNFHNCEKENVVSYSIDIVEVNENGNYLSASIMPLPTLYFALSLAYVVMAIVWNTVLCKSKDTVYKMHYLMLVVVFVKSLSCLFHAINYHFIQKEGIHEEAWAVLFYIAYLTRGALLFVTIILIGAGWAFIKHVLSDREKKLFLIVIPLQILDNIAWIIVEESEEGESQYTTWKEIFILIDLLCCGAILFPVVWSIRHLQEASRADGKEEFSLTKLKLFRQFYIMIVCYIYFTRIIVYLLKMTVPFQYEWLNELFRELATILFFIITGYKFKPAADNPYLQVPTEDDEEMEMEEVIIGKSASLDTVKKVNQGNRDDTSGPKLRESSHEYD